MVYDEGFETCFISLNLQEGVKTKDIIVNLQKEVRLKVSHNKSMSSSVFFFFLNWMARLR